MCNNKVYLYMQYNKLIYIYISLGVVGLKNVENPWFCQVHTYELCTGWRVFFFRHVINLNLRGLFFAFRQHVPHWFSFALKFHGPGNNPFLKYLLYHLKRHEFDRCFSPWSKHCFPSAMKHPTELIDSFIKQYILIDLQDLKKSNANHTKEIPHFSSCSFSHCILFIFCSSHLHQTCLFITTPLVQTSYWRVEHRAAEKQVQRHQAQQSHKKHAVCCSSLDPTQPLEGLSNKALPSGGLWGWAAACVTHPPKLISSWFLPLITIPAHLNVRFLTASHPLLGPEWKASILNAVAQRHREWSRLRLTALCKFQDPLL